MPGASGPDWRQPTGTSTANWTTPPSQIPAASRWSQSSKTPSAGLASAAACPPSESVSSPSAPAPAANPAPLQVRHQRRGDGNLQLPGEHQRPGAGLKHSPPQRRTERITHGDAGRLSGARKQVEQCAKACHSHGQPDPSPVPPTWRRTNHQPLGHAKTKEKHQTEGSQPVAQEHPCRRRHRGIPLRRLVELGARHSLAHGEAIAARDHVTIRRDHPPRNRVEPIRQGLQRGRHAGRIVRVASPIARIHSNPGLVVHGNRPQANLHRLGETEVNPHRRLLQHLTRRRHCLLQSRMGQRNTTTNARL